MHLFNVSLIPRGADGRGTERMSKNNKGILDRDFLTGIIIPVRQSLLVIPVEL